MSPSPFVPLAMFCWLFFSPLLFYVVKPRIALIVHALLAWMFLPMHEYDLPGLPPFRKMTVLAFAALAGVVLTDWRRLIAFRPSWIDLPMLVWCLVPLASVLANGPLDSPNAPQVFLWNAKDLRTYDAFAVTFVQCMSWGVPYVLGRIYLGSSESHRQLAGLTVMAALVYIPLCAFEMKMSPKLHQMVYGFIQHDINQAYRFGGWRPMVFMEHGLMVAFWMMSATLMAAALWASGSARRLLGVPFGFVFFTLLGTTIMCRSLGAWVQMLLGLALLFVLTRVRIPALVAVLAIVPPIYIGARTVGGWDGQSLVRLIGENISEERAQSLDFRMTNENVLVGHAMKRPLLGWAGFDRNRVFDEYGKDISVTDGMWVIALGTYGLIGMTALFGWLLLPPVLALRALGGAALRDPVRWCTLVLALISLMFALDAIPNAMENPLYVLIAGGLVSFAAERSAAGRVRRPAPTLVPAEARTA